MKKFLLPVFLSLATCVNAQVSKIDHFFLSSPNAEKLFHLFKDDFGLPVAWDYRNWGTFASGAVTLGNVSFEFVQSDSLTATVFDAIALEPLQSVEELLPILDLHLIEYDSIENNTYVKADGSLDGWSTLNLPNLIPEESGLFICDYKNRAALVSSKIKDSTALVNVKGGPLGIISLTEIVVTSPESHKFKMKLKSLPGVSDSSNNLFSFSTGPSIRLSDSKSSGIEKIVIQVYSLEEAKNHLSSVKMLGLVSEKSVFIDPPAIEGLLIELKE